MPTWTGVSKIKTPTNNPGAWTFEPADPPPGIVADCEGPATIIFVMDIGPDITFPIASGDTAHLHMVGGTVDITLT